MCWPSAHTDCDGKTEIAKKLKNRFPEREVSKYIFSSVVQFRNCHMQCDQIRRNFDTWAKNSNSLWQRVIIYDRRALAV